MAAGLSKEFSITGKEGLKNINLDGNTITITDFVSSGDAPISFDENANNPTIENATIQSNGKNQFVAVDSVGGITITDTNFINNHNCNAAVGEIVGGALFVESENNVIENCVFDSNYAACTESWTINNILGYTGYSTNGVAGAICIVDDDEIRGIDAFVTIRNTTFATATDTIYCEGQMTIEGEVSFAGNIVMSKDSDQTPELVNNGTMIFDLSARKTSDGALIDNWGSITGDGDFKIKVLFILL